MNRSLIIALIMMCLMYFLGALVGFFKGERSMREEAIEAGVAKYVLTDQSTGETKFRFITELE